MRSKVLYSAITVTLVLSVTGIAAVVAGQSSGAAAARSATAKPSAHPLAAPATATPGENPILYFAAREKGVANCSGGGDWYGPSDPSGSGCTTPGFGCMSLAQFAVYQGTGGKVKLPINAQLAGVGTVINPPSSGPLWAGLKPGDVTYWGGTLSWYYHSGIYVGNGEILDAVGSDTVGLRSFAVLLAAPYSYDYDGAIRFNTKPLLSVSTTALPTGSPYSSSKKTYSSTLHASSGTAPYRWQVIGGSLPTGLSLSKAGVISGRATKAETSHFVVQVWDTKTSQFQQQTATKLLSIKIT